MSDESADALLAGYRRFREGHWAEAKAEYEAHINAPRPAGKGGRPKKKKAPAEEIELDDADALGDEG